MNMPHKKLNSGFEMPVFGLGTWEMGGRTERDEHNDDKRDVLAIQKAIELGISHIDTAEAYAAGFSETLVGNAIKGIDRSKLFLVSKVKKDNLNYDSVFRACEASLKRIGTNYLDLYLIHSPNPDIPMEETFKALDKLVVAGLIKNIGVSNFKTERLRQAQQLTNNKIVLNQVYYNLVMREPEHEGLLDYCQKNDVFLEAYRPIDKGALLVNSGGLLEEMSHKYNKTPAQVAINWLTSQQNVVAIAKASNLHHIEENLGSVGWDLENAEIERLRKEFPNQIDRPENLPLK
jgi:diketogulonate reductase-like aldo/keto reductase